MKPCPIGHYCIVGAKYECYGGWFCTGGGTPDAKIGASSPIQEDGTMGKECSKGKYCPPGTIEEVECPGSGGPAGGSGTYQPYFGAIDEDDCI